MNNHKLTDCQIARYCAILGIFQCPPTLEALTDIVQAHLARIPFENISKLYYLKRDGLRGIIPFDHYLDGVEQNHFGGTCYTNNFYLHLLLTSLGYDISLCGADMSKPDVHLVNLVRLEGREYVVDVGYAAPFLKPLPRDSKEDYVISLGADKYVLKPQVETKRSKLELYRNGELKHGLEINPKPREIEEFKDVIANSFNDKSAFMKGILIVRFTVEHAYVIHNMTFLEIHGTSSKKHTVANQDELISLIHEHFGMPLGIVREALADVKLEIDAWG